MGENEPLGLVLLRRLVIHCVTSDGKVVDTDRVTFARLQRAPKSLFFGEADVAQR